jgi:Tfp pilus assembly protein PilV
MIEFMIALLLLTIVIVGTMSLQFTALRTSTESRYTSSAMTLAQSALEDFRSRRFSGIVCASAPTTYDWFDVNTQVITGCPSSTTNSCTDAAAFFTRSTALAPTMVVTVNGCRATVTVSWVTSQGTQQVSQTMDRTP